MRCSSYALMMPGSDARFHFSSTITNKPDPFIRFPMSVSKPTRVQVGTRATVNDRLVKEEAPASGLSFYELLGIPESGSLPDIKQAYKQLALKYHPDVSPPDRLEEYTQRFIRVQEAYETLSDPRRRAMYDYDRDMVNGLHFAFSAKRRCQYDVEMEEKRWKNLWQSQLSELKKRSLNRDAGGNMSWGARMRRKKDESPEL
ncbi:DnaJ domain-containing protein [Cephalotus follicularis]|uniref:DnaJ domain-containing protein n=1 Tax=Cephalotus follicularis TaxID=3775 RepID=A0A1Q3ATA7_CEPFO|nr:DnaJ domain-containing protein [Cephalotus follicularis]